MLELLENENTEASAFTEAWAFTLYPLILQFSLCEIPKHQKSSAGFRERKSK